VYGTDFGSGGMSTGAKVAAVVGLAGLGLGLAWAAREWRLRRALGVA
jgi:hypothetical protein